VVGDLHILRALGNILPLLDSGLDLDRLAMFLTMGCTFDMAYNLIGSYTMLTDFANNHR
jgi:hypothetical protein